MGDPRWSRGKLEIICNSSSHFNAYVKLDYETIIRGTGYLSIDSALIDLDRQAKELLDILDADA